MIERKPDGTYQLSGYTKLETATLSDEDIQQTHPGFTVTCNGCGSKRVIFENSTGASPESGAWGSVDLLCLECMTGVELI